jgi:hypothetical protein
LVDFYITNRGKISAIGPQHQGTTLGSKNKIPSIADYDAIFTFLKAQIDINKEVRTSEMQPGQTNISFRVPPAAVHGGDVANYDGYKNGDQYVYVMALIRYRDTTLEEHKYIYTESCILFFAHAQYLCEGGHNQTYIQ